MSGTPRPGKPARGSRAGRPLFALLDLITRRWSMRIIWELQGGTLTFLELQSACDGMSSSTLTIRIRELSESHLIYQDDGGRYGLTALGSELPPAFAGLIEWSEKWASATDS